MEKNSTFWIDYQLILDLPAGPLRGVLARKALALHAGRDDTGFLSIEHELATDDEVISLLFEVRSSEAEGIIVRSGSDPADVTDGTRRAVSIEDYFVAAEAANIALARQYKKEIKILISQRLWHDAAMLCIAGLYELQGNRRRGMVKLLAKLESRSVAARLYYGKALLRGENHRRELELGIDLLLDVTGHEDPKYAGYAHLLLGEELTIVEGMGYQALRHFEGAAYLGWEDASEYAGVICQVGGNGVVKDVARAAKNFRYGISKGSFSCMTKYAVMVLTGEVPYDPSWKSLYEKALDQREMLAMRIHGDLIEAQNEAEGDMDRFISACRARIDSRTANYVHPSEYVHMAG